MDLKVIGTKLIMSKLGGGDKNAIGSALEGLLGSGTDLSGVLSKFTKGGLGDQLASWLGDGDNDEISPDQVTQALGSDKVSEFAAKLGTDERTAASSLSAMLPSLIDKNSKGGSLLGSVGGFASKLFD